MSEPWRPLFEEAGEAAETYDALVEGVPRWLQASLASWIKGQVLSDHSYEDTLERLRWIERGLRWKIDWSVVNQSGALPALMLVARTDTDLLKLTDYLLSACRNYTAMEELKYMLEQAGSAWTVGERVERPGLVRRVPEGVQEAAEGAFAIGDAGRLLRQAWGAIFGLDPNPSEAYRLAVKAVEAAAIPVVSPANAKATLGTVIKQLEDQGDWSLPFERQHAKSPAGEVLLGMLRTLWHGQHDRHAGGDPDLPLSVSAAEAQAAVAMSVTLVQWFTGRSVTRGR